ncbi:MAG: hypothetical protein P4N59_11555 [Negativicutes bacterium]|nr:hypothetical protein [Negativicutes bacterium]
MAATSMKNEPLSNAGLDLGLGDQLASQAQDEIQARKKKANQDAMSLSSAMSPAALTLGLAAGKGISV